MVLLIVLSGLIISICMGLRQSLGLFMPPMTVELGISAATFSFSIALQNIVWGVAQPFVGAAADRYGARPVLIVTALIYAIGLVLMVFAPAFAGALHVAGFVIGIGIAGTGFGVLIGAVARATPPEKRSQTVGIVAAAGSLGTILLAPLGQGLIDAFGWRAAMLAFAAIAASIALLSLPIREQPAASATRVGQKLGDALREAVAHRGFLFMTLAFFACGFQLRLHHYAPAGVPAALRRGAGVGASALALIGLFNTVGTYVFGLLGARYSQKHLLALIYLARTADHRRVPAGPGERRLDAGLRLGDGSSMAGRRPAHHRHHRPRVRPHALQHDLRRGVPEPPGRLVLRRVDGRRGVRPRRQLRLRLGALIVIGATAFALQWLMDERPPAERVCGKDWLPSDG